MHFFAIFCNWLDCELTKSNNCIFLQTNCSTIDYIHSLYENLLLREPDINGQNYWLDQINGGIETRTEVFLGFAQAAALVSSANIDALF